MKAKIETRGRPRDFKDPSSLTLKIERTDRIKWQSLADSEGISLNQWMIKNAKAGEKAAP